MHPGAFGVGFVGGVIGTLLWPLIRVGLLASVITVVVMTFAESVFDEAKLGAMALVNEIAGKEVYPLPLRDLDLRKRVRIDVQTGIMGETRGGDRVFLLSGQGRITNTIDRVLSRVDIECIYQVSYGDKKLLWVRDIELNAKPHATSSFSFSAEIKGETHVQDYFCHVDELHELDQWPWLRKWVGWSRIDIVNPLK